MKVRYFLIYLSLFLLSTLQSQVFAWDDCPKNLVNDPYPGECGRYIDTNNDSICDHSQPEPTPISKSSETILEPESTRIVSNPNLLDELKESPSSSESPKPLTVNNSIPSEILSENTKTTHNPELPLYENSNNTPKAKTKTYNFFLLTVVPLITFFLSLHFQKNLVKFNFFWNSLLIISSIPSVIFGFYLALSLTYPSVKIFKSFDFLYWHVQGSLLFSTIVFCHLVQRIKQYIFQAKFSLKKNN